MGGGTIKRCGQGEGAAGAAKLGPKMGGQKRIARAGNVLGGKRAWLIGKGGRAAHGVGHDMGPVGDNGARRS